MLIRNIGQEEFGCPEFRVKSGELLDLAGTNCSEAQARLYLAAFPDRLEEVLLDLPVPPELLPKRKVGRPRKQ